MGVIGLLTLYFHLQDKWFGVIHHVVGKHEWSSGKCSHDKDEELKGNKSYLKSGSPAHEALKDFVMDKHVFENISLFT